MSTVKHEFDNMTHFYRLMLLLLALTTTVLPIRESRAHASSGKADFPVLRPGDVILLDLGCYTCRMISATTQSPFNHSGLVIETSEDGQVWVAQSLTKTERMPLQDFLGQARRPGAVMVRRPVELGEIYRTAPDRFASLAQRLRRVFIREFEGRPFDNAFLWDNTTPDGTELLYCSEMVQKALNKILQDDLSPSPMDFSLHLDFWTRYFHGQVPQGQLGNSPASLERDPLLMTVWEKAGK